MSAEEEFRKVIRCEEWIKGKETQGWFSDGKPYACAMCENSYKRKGNCRTHKKELLVLKEDLRKEAEATIQSFDRAKAPSFSEEYPDEDDLKLLEDPALFEKIIQEFSKKIVGEVDTKKVIFLCSCGRLVKNARPISYHLLVNAPSGCGKDFITKNVLKVYPPELYEYQKRISRTALTYWHNQKDEPDWSWDGRLLYLEDVEPDILNSPIMKVMSSGEQGEEQKAVITKDGKAESLVVQGTPVIIMTTASGIPNQEALRRFQIVNLDESEAHTRAIIQRQALQAEGGLVCVYSPSFSKAIKKLKRVSVYVPFGGKIQSFFPSSHLHIRTHFERFLDYIRASCAFHQYSRKKNKEGFYLAEQEDYNIAREVLLKTTSNVYMVPLAQSQQKVLDVVRDMEKYTISQSKKYSVSQIEKHVTFLSVQGLRKILEFLADKKLLEKDMEKREESFKPVKVYRYLPHPGANIPIWGDIYGSENPAQNKEDASGRKMEVEEA